MIRNATEADLPAVLQIYNHEILNSTSVYTLEEVDLAERREWFQTRRSAGFPVLVAHSQGLLSGFASYGEWRSRPGYVWTVEHSVYVDAAFRGQGVGRALLSALIDHAVAAGKHVMVGGVDAQNASSLAFHERMGFVQVGHFHEVGRKFGRWLDLIFVERRL